MSPTLRQTMADLLRAREMSARELADLLLLTPREVEEHLAHLARSLKKNLAVRPASCQACGFEFTRGTRLKAPGRCPRCKGQRVAGPWFSVEGGDPRV